MSYVLFTRNWWKCAGIRALKTLAQTMIATIGTSYVLSDVDWKLVLSASILAAFLSFLTSIAGLPELEQDVREIELLETFEPFEVEDVAPIEEVE